MQKRNTAVGGSVSFYTMSFKQINMGVILYVKVSHPYFVVRKLTVICILAIGCRSKVNAYLDILYFQLRDI